MVGVRGFEPPAIFLVWINPTLQQEPGKLDIARLYCDPQRVVAVHIDEQQQLWVFFDKVYNFFG